jgi:5-methylcytosine-specific restriction endonuclease McrA
MKRNHKEYNKHKKSNCQACGHSGSFYPLDIDHVLTYKAHPELQIEPRNLLTLCRKCHVLKGQKGLNYMSDNYPGVMSFLKDNGWHRCRLTNKWRLNTLQDD